MLEDGYFHFPSFSLRLYNPCAPQSFSTRYCHCSHFVCVLCFLYLSFHLSTYPLIGSHCSNSYISEQISWQSLFFLFALSPTRPVASSQTEAGAVGGGGGVGTRIWTGNYKKRKFARPKFSRLLHSGFHPPG